MGTDLNQGAVFATPPVLPHGLNGIIVHMKARIGKNCYIWQQAGIVSYEPRYREGEVYDNRRKSYFEWILSGSIDL